MRVIRSIVSILAFASTITAGPYDPYTPTTGANDSPTEVITPAPTPSPTAAPTTSVYGSPSPVTPVNPNNSPEQVSLG